MSVPVVATSKSPEETRDLGRALAGLLVDGDVVLLTGDLGAGKTVMAQGIARGLGVEEPVTSPTFSLVDEHECASGLRLLHVDVYRLDDVAQMAALGLGEEVDDGRTVAVVEWGERAAGLLSGDRLEIVVDAGAGENDRSVELRLVGPSWEARRGRVLLALRGLAEDGGGGGYDWTSW